MVDRNSKSYGQWPQFYDHPFIRNIAEKEKWSISQKNKCPIDMYELSKGKIRGCVPNTPYATDTLAESIHIMETKYNEMPANHAFLMNVEEDNFVLLDVEPKCPPHIMRKFLQLPYIYAEKSMSGRGIHIIMPVPDEYWQYPALHKLQKIQEKHRYYEIMFDHWVTFTRNMLKPSNPNANDAFYHEIFNDLASQQIEKTTTDLAFDMNKSHIIDISNIPGADEILSIACKQGANEYKKTLNDWNNDTSAFVFGIAGHYYGVMDKLMRSSFIRKLKHIYTPQERTLILYEIIHDKVPKRAKNDERRGNTTWLMAQCQHIVANRLGNNQQRRDNTRV